MDIDRLIADKGGIRLDIGCGANKQKGFVGMDHQPLEGVDVVWDWNQHPWPFPDESVLQAVASHVVEHIPTVALVDGHTRLPFIEFMNEVWRILKPGGQFAIAYPHGSSQGFLQDPTHCHALNETTWAYFDPLEPNTQGMLYKFYRPLPWKIDHLSWSPAANVEALLSKRMKDRSYDA
jgi:SAM-dependent methyltransferase